MWTVFTFRQSRPAFGALSCTWVGREVVVASGSAPTDALPVREGLSFADRKNAEGTLLFTGYQRNATCLSVDIDTL